LKIVHWVHFDKRAWSGLYQRAYEFQRAEVRQGVVSGFCDPIPQFRDGYEIENSGRKLVVAPWSWAKDADVNVVESHTPAIISALRNRVFIAHGGPKYCAEGIVQGNADSMISSIDMVRICELVIVQNRFHKKFWEEFAPGKVYHVRGGIDLDLWKPEGETKELFVNHPAIVYMDMWRSMKLPTTLIMAMPYVLKEIPTARLNLLNVPSNQVVFWVRFMTKLGVDTFCEQFRPSRILKPDVVYRAADILVDPCEGGSNSGVGLEAMACGCPVIFLEGHPDTHGVAKCEDDPKDMARAIVEVWNQDQKELRRKARAIAEKFYDVNRTAKEMIDLYSRVFGI